MFSKVLIANRGEIALRIVRTLRVMGVKSAVVYAEADRLAPHVSAADEAWPLGEGGLAETYLDGAKLIEIARRGGCQAVHPGYGFLSENPSFARACELGGLVFIGPGADAMELLGNKARAKLVAASAQVPTVPGEVLADPAGAEAAAQALGFPLLVKAVAGGGGRGQRLVAGAPDLRVEVEAASREAKASFGDGRVFLERFVANARHVEVQVLADASGDAVHVFERECSMQRRRQKLIEETPAATLKESQREALWKAALALVQTVGYRNAGTVEFLVAPDGAYYFLEVNTRLQVEHPITEAVTGLDLVREQVRIASGEPLSREARLARSRGHAIECRICAEDPYAGFAPSAGTLLRWRPPSGPGIRVDGGVVEGQALTTAYDSLLAKVIAWGEDRETARRRMIGALRELEVLGVATTAPFLARVLEDDAFRDGAYHTRFLEERAGLYQPTEVDGELAFLAEAIAAARGGRAPRPAASAQAPPARGPWQTAGGWRLG